MSEEGGETERIKAVRGVGIDGFGKLFGESADARLIAKGGGVEDVEDGAALGEGGRDGGLAVVAGEGGEGNALGSAGLEEFGMGSEEFADLGRISLLDGGLNGS